MRQLLESRGIKHIYEAVPGQKIFATREALALGLGDSVMSVCFPAAVTHPETSQGLSTATHRYFESMASKCILVGEAPDELIELFGYNPVVTLSRCNVTDHLLEILGAPERYRDLVEQNYARLQEVGTWQARAKQIVSCISETLDV
ncbi:MAG: glycosyltransferase family 1 protein [Methanoregulaceae archaeon]|nr:glycosyltransferase family 1 protein [Methanoregulaceae archaeon]